MAPERVMALLKAHDALPEPLEPTPGHTPTRVLDAAELANAHVPEPRRPFEVVESIPARPPRAPKVPSDFSTLPAEKTPTEKTPTAAAHRDSAAARFTRAGGLMLMAILVFGLTFGVTKALRDERALPRAKKALIEGYDRAAARLDAWFGATPPVRTAPTEPAPASKAPQAATPELLTPTQASSSEPAPPVVRLEDLKLLESGAAERVERPAPAPTRR